MSSALRRTPLLTAAEAGELLGYTARQMHAMAKRGRITSYGRHKRRRFDVDEVRRELAQPRLADEDGSGDASDNPGSFDIGAAAW